MCVSDEKEPEWSLSGAWRPATASVSTAQLPTSPIGTAGMDRRSYLTSTFGPEFFMRRPRSTTARSHSAFVGAGASMMDSTGEPTPQWTAALTGSPRTWPAEVGYVQGFKRDPSAPALCEEFRPSSRSSRDRSPTGSRSGSHAGSRPTSGSAAVGAKRVRVTDQRHSVAEGDSYVLRGSRAGRGGRSPSPGAVEGDSFVLAGEAARMRRAASTPGGKSRPGSRARSTLSRSVSFHPTVSDAELRRQKAARKERKKKAKSISMQRRGLKYWSACTVMYSQSETEQSLKASAQRMQKERAQRSKMKWKELLHLYNCLRAPTRRQVGVDEIDVLYSQLRKACAEAGSANSIGREAFWRIVGQVDMPMTSANRLYSGFDTERRDEMDIREFVCSLRLFRKYGTEPLIDKLVAMFDYYLYHDHTGKLRRADVVSLLQTCAEKELDKEVLDRMAQKAMNERLGTKSLWAVDMTKDDLKGILEDNPYLLNTIQRQLDENMPAH